MANWWKKNVNFRDFWENASFFKIDETYNGLKILDAMSGCGIRAIRFLKELDNVQFVVANDICEKITHLIEKNIKINDIDSSKIKGSLYFSFF